MAVIVAMLVLSTFPVDAGEVADMAKRLGAVRPLDSTLRCQACKSIIESLFWDVQHGKSPISARQSLLLSNAD